MTAVWDAALTRTRTAMVECGRVLIYGEAGLGTTYVALATATRYARVLLVTPAVLGPRWHEARAQMRVDADLISIESLSYTSSPTRPYDLIVVDVPLHGYTASLHRYARLASRYVDAHVLALFALPPCQIHDASVCGCQAHGSVPMMCYIASLYDMRAVVHVRPQLPCRARER